MKPRRNVKRVSSRACSINSSQNPNKNLSLNKRSLKKSKMSNKKKMKKKKLIYLIMRTTLKMLRSIIILLQCLGSYNCRHKMMTLILLLTEKSSNLIKSQLTSKNSTSCNKEKIIRPRFRIQCRQIWRNNYMSKLSRTMNWRCSPKMIKKNLSSQSNSLKSLKIEINGSYQNGV